ncbi:hypothetical protein BcDW1_3603 [Botrytis cinerea BcDW1]|uniref:Uncharacterized protein n=1 Tax=Botryotinia fuckeliana (strain BcDW1) TaxID=1290391 RepID=M7ULU2_BOTF1|nr:hypothetical protein BcDW1_3603 [Botrytis cinerea BcDW1]
MFVYTFHLIFTAQSPSNRLLKKLDCLRTPLFEQKALFLSRTAKIPCLTLKLLHTPKQQIHSQTAPQQPCTLSNKLAQLEILKVSKPHMPRPALALPKLGTVP